MPIFVCFRRLVTSFETSDQMVYKKRNTSNGLIDQGFNLLHNTEILEFSTLHTLDNSVKERVECDSFMEFMVLYISKKTRLSLHPGVKTAVRN